jgi:hypothetical protein
MAVNSGLLKIENKAITGVTSHQRCIIEDGYQLSEMIEKIGDKVCKNNVHNFIELFVIEIFEWFGKEIKENMSQNLAKKIHENYYFLKIAEFKLFVERIKSGHWKQVHGMSPAVLMERLNDFALESMNHRESLAANSKQNTGNFLAENGELIAEKLMAAVPGMDKFGAYQWAIGILCGIAGICMYFPVFAIDEKKYTKSEPSAVPFKEALLMTFKNKDFLFFAISDFNYFLSITILTTGLSYYITVLLFQEASLVSEILPVMLFSSFLCYPIVNYFAKKFGKKRLVLYGFFVFFLLFVFIYFFL